ncbi:asparagine synthase-related protein [Bacillus sp. NPDC094106]|uniref:asparagine synthase-related protein n=1 Tax=Bacillus sp. NPDC094106 TaxID=3363949 RepID=UPI003824C188
MLKQYINQCLEERIYDKNSVALLFSGGMDSLSLLLSCLESGIRPTLYTFYLKSYTSSDIECSRKIADIFDLQLIEIPIEDTSVTQLEADVRLIIKTFDVKKKTAIQCIYPFLYVTPAIKETFALTGLCADDLYGTPRSMAKHAKDMERFDEIRDKRIYDDSASSYKQIKQLLKMYDKEMVAPYKESDMLIQYLRSMTYKEMNSPKQKIPAYLSYQKEIEYYELYRRNENLQCSSRIREWHDSLLATSLNLNNQFKTIVSLYNHLHKEIHGDSK